MAYIFRGHCSLSMSVSTSINLPFVGNFGLQSPVSRVTRSRVRMISAGSSDICSRGVWTKSSVLHLFYNDVYKVDLPPGHRFPMEKYRLVREVAANVALRDYPETIRQIMIVDLDVHQGNGNARLFADKPSVFTFSVHCRENYFSKVEKSDVDVEVDEGASDDEYLGLLHERLPLLVDEVDPDLIFYQGGIDPIEIDRLGKLKLTREGLRRRNRLVYEIALRRGTPTVVTMGGGYPKNLSTSSESFRRIVRSHQDVYLDAAEVLLSSISPEEGVLETLGRSEGAVR